MGIPVAIPRSVVERKPPHGSPCNRCGGCCMATLCPLAQKVFRFEIGRCPALIWSPENPEASCGLVAEPAKHYPLAVLQAGGEENAGKAAALLVGAGTGCDARINGEAPNEAFYEELRRWDRRNESAVRRARKVWGV
jgi:hypothetical protein